MIIEYRIRIQYGSIGIRKQFHLFKYFLNGHIWMGGNRTGITYLSLYLNGNRISPDGLKICITKIQAECGHNHT